MINEIFISDWDPVVPLPLMTQAQKDNELERIFESMCVREMGNYSEPGGAGSTIGRFKRDPDREFDRGFAKALDLIMNGMLAIDKWAEAFNKANP